LSIVQGWGSGAGNLVKVTSNVSTFLSDILDSHKVYYGKFLFGSGQRCS
jgi:hypothetical protein